MHLLVKSQAHVKVASHSSSFLLQGWNSFDLGMKFVPKKIVEVTPEKSN